MNNIDEGNYELLRFTDKNENCFSFVNKDITISNPCYEIKLLSLTLPNVLLKGNFTVTSYPYFYVEFQNEETNNFKELIYSNNRNNGVDKSVLFRATNTNDSDNSKEFLKLSGDGMSQVVTNFDVAKNFIFAIYLPNGELFETLLKDNISPALPNDSIQISCLFSIRRL